MLPAPPLFVYFLNLTHLFIAPHAVQHMGVADIVCVSGCTCTGTQLDATWRAQLSLMVFKEVQVGFFF